MTYGPAPRWTPERDAVIKTMRAEHVPYAQIAAHLGETANAVIGRAHRIGLNGGAEKNPVRAKKKSVAVPVDVIAVGPTSSLAPPRDDRGCRWPMWGDKEPISFKFCCAAKAGPLSYCAAHAKRAYAPAQPLRPRAVRA